MYKPHCAFRNVAGGQRSRVQAAALPDTHPAAVRWPQRARSLAPHTEAARCHSRLLTRSEHQGRTTFCTFLNPVPGSIRHEQRPNPSPNPLHDVE